MEETHQSNEPTTGTALATTGKGNARVRAILEEAKNILVEEGFAELSFRTLAKRCGITVGNVTYYFPTKELLMEQLAVYIFDRWDEGFQRRVPERLTDHIEIFEYSVRYMIEENKRPRTNALLQEMWAISSRSDTVMRMLDVFYAKMRAWIEGMLAGVNSELPIRARKLRAALITSQIEGLIVLIGPRRIPHDELRGLEEAALVAIRQLAIAPDGSV
ncbi:TetR/AcrR family transcriptional regulator [Rhizobium vallis]|uniref:TetR/AcrR family transcriptional regulator n=1 Tax=Rhizobium vallis TaxID=634290 RepID=A0A432PCT3_9HYPH|nr:TetR/AcrR family transcriptional regulator [Rhizobium vallis]RUM20514.1 TetR/AcrR family transcriptional regulator [Rhizobium vallis]